ncbi:hypothetical protein [Mycobacterium sp. E740]|uniref:hypothetical protein n=1 Tax=Mycobacterium sp. E740 TaxID=1834149 RepID=UPI0007FD4573|nr:hypothetical protein [Mycobacterium sp. E740]OBI72017.1 hypothetical protein A5663_08590 [Mycobacterium sp. E740]
MKQFSSGWPICGKCCEVAYFPWLGGAHRCDVTSRDDWPDYDFFEWEDDSFESRPFDDFRYEDGLHRLLWDVIAHSAEVAASAVSVTLRADGGVEVSHDGRDPNLDGAIAALQDNFLSELACRTAFPDLAAAYVEEPSERNSLPARLDIEIHRDGFIWFQRYDCGVARLVECRGATTKTGVTVRCWPESLVCEMTDGDAGAALKRLQRMAFLREGLTIDVVDDRRTRPARSRTFCYPGGLVDYCRFLTRISMPLHDNVIQLSGRRRGFAVEIAMRWTTGYSPTIQVFDTFSGSPRPSAHEEAIAHAVTATVAGPVKQHVADRIPLPAAVPDLTTRDIAEGLTAVVNVRHRASPPEDERPSPEVVSIIYTLCHRHLAGWLDANPRAADLIADKAIAGHHYARMPRRSFCRG